MKYIFLMLLLAPHFIIAQDTLQGKVVNGKTRKGIPYATVGIIQSNRGTNADKDGSFKFTTSKSLQDDTLLISSTGYQPLSLAVSSFTNEVLELIEDTTILKEIVVTGDVRKKWQTIKLNDFSNKSGSSFFCSEGSQVEVALHLQLPGDDGFLKEVKIRQGGMGAFGADKTIFRLKIYGFDSLTKGPSNELYSQLVEVESNGMNTTKIDLEEHQIYLLQKDFFVAVEWLKIPINEVKGTAHTKSDTEQDFLFYRPNISTTDKTIDQPAAWSKSYTGIWRKQWDAGKYNLAIAATVKY